MKTRVKIGFCLIVVILLFFSLFYSCDSGDSCDKAREECYERGGTPQNCKKDSSPGCFFYEEECVCECVKMSSGYMTSEMSLIIETENTEITSVLTVEGDESFFYDNVSFGALELGDNREQTISIFNKGTTKVIISEVSELHVPFTIVSDICSNREIEPSEKCEIVIAFTPLQKGMFTEDLEIYFNDSEDTVISLSIKGNGID
jgi:hypothetical protein